MDNVNEWEELVKIVPAAILTFSQTPTVREIESLRSFIKAQLKKHKVVAKRKRKDKFT